MAAEDYCTVADVRAYLGLSASDNMGPDDSTIASLITNSSRMIDAYAQRQFSSQESVVEYFDTAFGLQHLTLSKRPVASLTSVELTSNGSLTALSIGLNRTSDDCYLSDTDAGIVGFYHPFTEELRNRIKVSYTTGYLLASIPAEVKQATILLTCRAVIRATLIDENCSERIKELWKPLLVATESEYKEMLDLVKAMKTTDVAVFGGQSSTGRYWSMNY